MLNNKQRNRISDIPMDALSTAIIILDPSYRIWRLNLAAEQLLGCSARHIASEGLFELIRGDLTKDILDSFLTQENSGFIEDIEISVTTGVIRTNLFVSQYETNRGSGLMLEFQKSERHQKIQKNLFLQQQSRVSEHLLRNLAHEIKNPLGGIKGAAQLLEKKLPSEISDRYTHTIIREADRLSSLVDRLLLTAKPEPKESINPHKVIEHALDIVLLQSKSTVEVKRDYDPSLPDIRISPNQIQQSLINLIKNAIEAMSYTSAPTKDPILTVRSRIIMQHTIGNKQHRQVIRIDVQDNGPGIPEDLVNDVFFPTISGKDSSGLGLSIAQSLVQRHSGIIELSQSTEQTCFSLYLPIK